MASQYLNEVGQTSSVHTNRLLSTEYRVKASINDCPALVSDPVSVFKSMQTTTVTITEVITISGCSSRNGNNRIEGENSKVTVSVDVAGAQIILDSRNQSL